MGLGLRVEGFCILGRTEFKGFQGERTQGWGLRVCGLAAGLIGGRIQGLATDALFGALRENDAFPRRGSML